MHPPISIPFMDGIVICCLFEALQGAVAIFTGAAFKMGWNVRYMT